MTIALDLEVADLAVADRAEAVGVLARGMRDNPLHIAVLGADPARRERALAGMFGGMLEHVPQQRPLVVREGGRIVAVAGAMGPGTCRIRGRQAVRLLPGMARLGPATLVRFGGWLKGWDAEHPHEPHSHLGPVAVDRDLQGRGIGSILLAEYARRLDAAGHAAYLETDKPENVRFYAREGFEVIAEAQIAGTPNWFMWRPAMTPVPWA